MGKYVSMVNAFRKNSQSVKKIYKKNDANQQDQPKRLVLSCIPLPHNQINSVQSQTTVKESVIPWNVTHVKIRMSRFIITNHVISFFCLVKENVRKILTVSLASLAKTANVWTNVKIYFVLLLTHVLMENV